MDTQIIENHPQDSRVKFTDTFQTLSGRMGTGGCNTPMVKQETIVRRLTPKECERLMAFPDDWTNIGDWIDSTGKVRHTTDGNRYRCLGNSIALPFWEWLAERMIDELQKSGTEHPTMASLFDGIGGFPLVYQRHGCEPVWASEIEEFAIAVTKYHFPESEERKEYELSKRTDESEGNDGNGVGGTVRCITGEHQPTSENE